MVMLKKKTKKGSYIAFAQTEGVGQRHEFVFCQKPRRLKY
jgi:hypothetical protein